ncbi:MAG TPA: surface-adhesin E family protein [Steroidobacteraceae bacterium]
MRWRTVLVAGLLSGALPAMVTQAAEWKRLYTAADRSVEMDLAGIRRQGDVVLAWVKFSYDKEQSDSTKGPYRSMLQLWAYQCGLGKHALMQFAEYSGVGGDGKVVASDARDRYMWSYPEPDTIGEAAMKIACNRAPKAPVSNASPTSL